MHAAGLTLGRALADAARATVESARLAVREHAPLTPGLEITTFATDGAAFISQLLQRIAPEHYEAVARHRARPHPDGLDYFEHFAAIAVAPRPGWRRIERLADGCEGDLLAWRVAHRTEERDGGRLAVMASVPQLLAEDLWIVRVYDASGVPHFDDSREQNGVYAPGTGVGAILVHTDGHGRPVGVRVGPHEALCAWPMAVVRIEAIEERR